MRFHANQVSWKGEPDGYNRLKWMKTTNVNLKSQLAKFGNMCFHLGKNNSTSVQLK